MCVHCVCVCVCVCTCIALIVTLSCIGRSRSVFILRQFTVRLSPRDGLFFLHNLVLRIYTCTCNRFVLWTVGLLQLHTLMIPYTKYLCYWLSVSSNFAVFIIYAQNIRQTHYYFWAEQNVWTICCGMYTCKGTFVQLKHKHFKRSSAESTSSTLKKWLRILVTSTGALVDPFLTLVIVYNLSWQVHLSGYFCTIEAQAL